MTDNGLNAEAILDALEAMDELLKDAVDMETCLREVTQSLLDVFDCDRAFAQSLVEPRLGGLFKPIVASRLDETLSPTQIPADTHLVRLAVTASLDHGGVVTIPAEEISADSPLAREYGVRAMTLVAVQPQLGPAWFMGLQNRAPSRDDAHDARLLGRMVARLLDVAARVAAMDQLRVAEERIEVLIHQAPEAILVIDVGTQRVLNSNAAAERLLGWSTGQLLGVSLSELNPDQQDDGRSSDEQITEILAAVGIGEDRSFAWTHRNRDGERLVCRVTMTALPNSERLLVRASLTLA